MQPFIFEDVRPAFHPRDALAKQGVAIISINYLVGGSSLVAFDPRCGRQGGEQREKSRRLISSLRRGPIEELTS
jgi:hypothetical protein